MPTGYTYKLYEGSTETPRSFILRCANAFNIESREHGSDYVPLREIPVSDHSRTEILKAELRLEEAIALTDDKVALLVAKHNKQVRKENAASKKEMEEREERFSRMKNAIHSWNPPTPKHENVKKFMLEQLATETFDVYVRPELTPESYRTNEIDRAIKQLQYVKEREQEEVARTNQRNAWVGALLDSLPQE